MHGGPAAPVQGFGGGHLREIGPPVLIETARLLLRRWRLVALALVLALSAGTVAVLATPWSYESRAQVLFLPPTVQPGVVGQVNPLLSLGPALRVTADIVRLGVSDDATRAELVRQGAIEEYEVDTYLADNGGPILNVKAAGPDAAQSRRTVTLLTDRIIGDLRTLQASADAPSNTYITASVLTETPKPERSVKDKVRSGAIAFPGVLVLLLALVVLGDRVAARRAARREREIAPDEARSRADAAQRPAPEPLTPRRRDRRSERANAADHPGAGAPTGSSGLGDRAGAGRPR